MRDFAHAHTYLTFDPKVSTYLHFDPTTMADNKDFEFQIRAEQEFKTTQQLQQDYRSEGSDTYVDPRDGTVYEWDPQRKGWFPKVPDYHIKLIILIG